VIRALPPAFVGNCPRGHCEQEWYKTHPLSKSTSLKSALNYLWGGYNRHSGHCCRT
jgi:hypothetical protein